MSISSIRARLRWLEEEISPDASLMGDADLRRAMGAEWAQAEPIIERISNGEDFENCVRDMMRIA